MIALLCSTLDVSFKKWFYIISEKSDILFLIYITKTRRIFDLGHIWFTAINDAKNEN